MAIALFAGWYFYYLRNSSGLDIFVSPPENISIGIPFTIRIGVSNLGANILNDAKISLALGEGMAFVGALSSKNSDTKNIGSIGSGSMIETNFEVIVLGGENASSTKKIIATASYLPKGVSSRFEKTQEGELVATSHGLALDLIMGDKVSPGEDFSFIMKYKNISGVNLKDLKLLVDYPAGFEFKKATLAPDIGKNIWELGDLRMGSEMEFKIVGNILGGESSVNRFTAKIISDNFGDSYLIAEKYSDIEITASSIELKILVNEGDDKLIFGKNEDLHYKIYYTNKADRGLEDAVISAQLNGDMFDFSSIKTNGIINPSGNSIVWNKITNRELSAIAIGGSGLISFDIKTKNNYPIRRLSDKNFILKINTKLESGIAGEKGGLIGVYKIENKIKGNVSVDTKVYFRDAESEILNKGSLPPKVGLPINYTVHWVITNYSTDISDINLQAVLGNNIKYTGISKTTSSTDLVYNSSNKSVSWRIDKISATRGLVDKPIELIFQIEALPDASQIGNIMPLMGSATITAKDEFTGLDLFSSGEAVTSLLKYDMTVGASDSVVIP